MENQSKMIDNVYCAISNREQINRIFETAEKYEVKIKEFDLEFYKENKSIVPNYCLLKSKILDTQSLTVTTDYNPIFKNEFNGMRHIAYSNFLHNLKLNFVEYKIGDHVKIIANESGHGFKIGEIVEIEKVYEIFLYCFNATNKWNVSFPDCEPYSKQVAAAKQEVKPEDKPEPKANEEVFVLPEINVLYECYETEIKIFPKHGMKFFFKKDKCIVIEKIAPEAKPLKKYITLWCEKNNAKFNFNYKKILDTAFTNFGDNGFLKELNKFQCLEILQLIADEKNKDKERLITHHIAFNPVRKKIDIIQLDYIYFDVEFYDRKDAEFVLKNYKELLNKINS
jgi:hypothetical protein